jgi:hypothetical protein
MARVLNIKKCTTKAGMKISWSDAGGVHTLELEGQRALSVHREIHGLNASHKERVLKRVIAEESY